MCVCVWDVIQTDKKDVVNFKLWTGMWSVSVHRSTIGYGGVSTREFGGPNWAHASFGKCGDSVGVGSGETWNSPLETIQGNSWVFIQYNTVTDQLTLSVQYMTSNTLHPVSTRKGGFGLERGGWWTMPSAVGFQGLWIALAALPPQLGQPDRSLAPGGMHWWSSMLPVHPPTARAAPKSQNTRIPEWKGPYRSSPDQVAKSSWFGHGDGRATPLFPMPATELMRKHPI